MAFGLFILGFTITASYLGSIPVARDFAGVVQFTLWVSVVSTLVGFGAASSAYFLAWLVGLIRLCEGFHPRKLLSWVAVVLVIGGAVFTFLFLGGAAAEESLDKSLWAQTRPVSVAVAILQAPGLVAFLALRSVADEDVNWSESGRCRLRLIRRLRAELRRLLTTYGAFLTLLVLATGMRRRALLSRDPELPILAEHVLLYGLLFAVLLGLFYLAAAGAIDHRADRIVEEFTPLPDPSDAALSDQVQRRSDLTTLTGSPGSWRTFETTVVIAAPLLSALIGIATGG